MKQHNFSQLFQQNEGTELVAFVFPISQKEAVADWRTFLADHIGKN